MKICDEILKKDHLNTIQILLKVKKAKRRPIIAPAIAVRLLTKIRAEYLSIAERIPCCNACVQGLGWNITLVKKLVGRIKLES